MYVSSCLASSRMYRFADRALVAFESELSGTLNDRDRVAREVIVGEKFTNFHFNEFEKFFVVNHVALVQEDDDVGNANLTSEKDVFTRLRHGYRQQRSKRG